MSIYNSNNFVLYSSDSSTVESKKMKKEPDAIAIGEEVVEEEIAGDDEDMPEEGEKTEKKEEREREKEKEKKDRRDESNSVKSLLKLVCTYCDVRCISFKVSLDS